MKLLRFGLPGQEKPGILDETNRIRDLSAVIGDISGDILSRAGLASLRAIDLESLPIVAGSPRLGSCVSGTSKIIGVGMNYFDHAKAIGAPPPKNPVLFFKPASSICGPNDDVLRPRGSKHLDWEVELALIIGEKARNVGVADSMDYVAGFCILNDITERRWIETAGQMINGKSADTFSPMGPWLVTADEINDFKNLDMFLAVNNEQKQRGNTKTMIFDVPTLVSHISTFMTLHPGDVITTGTPPGIGMRMKPPQYLEPEDRMYLSIVKLGEQRQRVLPLD